MIERAFAVLQEKSKKSLRKAVDKSSIILYNSFCRKRMGSRVVKGSRL